MNPPSPNPSRFSRFLPCVLSLLALPAFARSETAPGVALVQALYETYAWEAVLTHSARRPLFDEPAETLRRYFDEPLTRLIRNNHECERRTREVCRLDMAPLWNSSDPGASDLRVEAGPAPGEARVRFHAASGDWVELVYELKPTRDGWRIHDIRYADGPSLVSRLASP